MKPCCADPANREDGPGPRGMDGLGEPHPDVTITHCQVCECRHVEAEIDPGQIGVKGEAL
jgi:hypothetical protein